MLLYHFTAAEYIEQIKVEGLTRDRRDQRAARRVDLCGGERGNPPPYRDHLLSQTLGIINVVQ